MIRIGVFNSSNRGTMLMPMIIKTEGTEPSTEIIAYYASQTEKPNKLAKNDSEEQ